MHTYIHIYHIYIYMYIETLSPRQFNPVSSRVVATVFVVGIVQSMRVASVCERALLAC